MANWYCSNHRLGLKCSKWWFNNFKHRTLVKLKPKSTPTLDHGALHIFTWLLSYPLWQSGHKDVHKNFLSLRGLVNSWTLLRDAETNNTFFTFVILRFKIKVFFSLIISLFDFKACPLKIKSHCALEIRISTKSPIFSWPPPPSACPSPWPGAT